VDQVLVSQFDAVLLPELREAIAGMNQE